jgi:hypothetical protein
VGQGITIDLLITNLYYVHMHGDEVYELETIEMDRYTVFNATFPPIKEPRWWDERFLINARVNDHNKIVCTYVRPNGERMFPEALYVSGRTARKYKSFPMPTKAGGILNVRAIPIKEFKILKVSERSIYELY